MQHGKKILVIGATGSMSRYLIPILVDNGCKVDGISLDNVESSNSNIRYIKADANDYGTFQKILEPGYDAVVDFMVYPTWKLFPFLPYVVEHTGHYVFLSSYRVYDNKELPLCEDSPRLLDTGDDIMLRNSDDYSVYKSRGENILRALPRKNWTIVRPAITYSFMRYQLVTLEAHLTVARAFAGKKTVLPEAARDVKATMTWGGDVAAMIGKLLFNENAFGKIFNVCTAEYHTWGEIAAYYHDLCGLEPVWVDTEEYLRILNPDADEKVFHWQLLYDRLFDRVMDNRRILAATGMEQKSLKPLYDGLKMEIAKLGGTFPELTPYQRQCDERMDLLLREIQSGQLK